MALWVTKLIRQLGRTAKGQAAIHRTAKRLAKSALKGGLVRAGIKMLSGRSRRGGRRGFSAAGIFRAIGRKGGLGFFGRGIRGLFGMVRKAMGARGWSLTRMPKLTHGQRTPSKIGRTSGLSPEVLSRVRKFARRIGQILK